MRRWSAGCPASPARVNMRKLFHAVLGSPFASPVQRARLARAARVYGCCGVEDPLERGQQPGEQISGSGRIAASPVQRASSYRVIKVYGCCGPRTTRVAPALAALIVAAAAEAWHTARGGVHGPARRQRRDPGIPRLAVPVQCGPGRCAVSVAGLPADPGGAAGTGGPLVGPVWPQAASNGIMRNFKCS